MSDSISVKVEGIEKLTSNLRAFGDDLHEGLTGAGQEAAREIIETEGVAKYPPSTAANEPPAPYYIRGRGMQYASGNNGKSERYGTQFTIEQKNGYTEIGNRASYAPYLGGDKQARAMAKIGWRKLADVAEEKIEKITKIFQAWIDRAIKKAGV